MLVYHCHEANDHNPQPTTALVNSQSVRWGLHHSDKRIDGHKRIKGIKRHVTVDSNGFVLDILVTKVNIQDFKAAYALIVSMLTKYGTIAVIKTDKGYSGKMPHILKDMPGIEMRCVKSNVGTSQFMPLHGRWVFERTFA